MSSVVKLRAVALRLLGATVIAGVMATSARLGATAAPTETISVLVPIVADAGDGQFISADELESETSPTGDWRLLADAAQRHGFTLAVDSRITASITLLGTDAPATVTEWYEDVTALDPLILPWGNADPWSFGPVSTNPFSAEQFAALAGVESASLVVWPSGGVVEDDSVSLTAARGFTRMIVGDDLFAGGFDSAASGALADAVSPDSSTSTLAAVAAVRTELDPSTALVLPANPARLDAARAVAVLDRLVTSNVRVTRVIPMAVNTLRTPTHTVAAPELLTDVVAAVHADSARSADMTDDPAALIAPRVRAMAVVTRDVTADEFDSAASAFLADSGWLSRVVGISLATEYTVLSNTADVPVSVSNDSDATVTVDVHVRATSGIVQVETPTQSVTIGPRSNVRILVAMTAVTNGRTSLVAKLVDPSGASIGKAVEFPIEVQAQWELLTIVLFAGGVSVIMTIGILRTIRRRRATA